MREDLFRVTGIQVNSQKVARQVQPARERQSPEVDPSNKIVMPPYRQSSLPLSQKHGIASKFYCCWNLHGGGAVNYEIKEVRAPRLGVAVNVQLLPYLDLRDYTAFTS